MLTSCQVVADKLVVSKLQREDDRSEDAKKIENRWYIKERIETQLQDDSGRLGELHPSLVKPGCFVDVVMSAAITRLPPLRWREVRIDFTMKRIVVLKTKSQV